ncbi:hypothetical protein [Caldimicrobium thiodismutans]|nr:hypothetical protein [Caldimicrobium thiodismutans]
MVFGNTNVYSLKTSENRPHKLHKLRSLREKSKGGKKAPLSEGERVCGEI